MISVSMWRLSTFGGLAVHGREGSPAPRLRPQRLAILAVVAAGGESGVTRDQLAAVFWPEAHDERARHSLRQALYALRQEIGAEVIRSDAALTLDQDAIRSDIGEFRAALAAGALSRAASLASRPFLHGFYLPGAPAFERWLEEERASLNAEVTRALVSLAKEAEAAGDHDGAAEWWRRLTVLDPLSGRFALGYLKALAACGDRAGALAFARAHGSVVRRELEADADPDIRRLEAELRAMPPTESVASTPLRDVSASRDRPGASEGADRESIAAVPDERGLAIAPGAPVPQPSEQGTHTAKIRGGLWTTRPARIAAAVAAGLVVLVGGLTAPRWRAALGFDTRTPTFAVGMIREDGVPDTLRIGGVLTDMLATNLARVAGLTVLANSRLFELMLPGQDTLVAGYSEAARRAGATEILQGRLLAGPRWSLAMEIQRVDLASGLVKGGYRVAANDRYALIDSMTAAIARDLHLGSPGGSVSEATTDSPIAYRLYEEGLRAYYQYDQPAAQRLMQAALREDSTFAMAAYYDALLAPTQGGAETIVRRRAIRLAARASERQRLTITADLLAADQDPSAIAVAETLVTRYPTDPRAFELLSRSLMHRGEWAPAVTAIERAIALDSASEPAGRQNCRLCTDFHHLAEIYLWWDSLPAAEHAAQRLLRVRPSEHIAWNVLLRVAAARGDTAATRAYVRRFHETNPFQTSLLHLARFATLAEEYDQAERDLRPLLDSPRPGEVSEARWVLSVAFRNQGRLEEALRLARRDSPDGDLTRALLALEHGDTRQAVALFSARARTDESMWSSGIRARHITWNRTLLGMALAAAGDTGALREVADTVEHWGQRSIYGRDRRAHHYVRGMLLLAEGRDEEAVAELQQAIHSPSHGFTRVNYELARTLMRLGRLAEAVPVARAALHGDIDGSNLYVTRTELHELLAQAFEGLGRRDSAAVHYRAVARAWERADPAFHARRARARAYVASGRAQAR